MVQAQDKSQGVFRSIDWWTILIYLVLVTAGWFCVVGASYNYDAPEIFDFAQFSGKQLVWIGCSFVLGLVLLLIDDRFFDTFANVIYILFVLVLAVTPFLAANVKGSYSWISLGPVNVQPAEFAKCATALALAHFMGKINFSVHDKRQFITALVIVLLPVLLIFLQRETGSALVYFAFFLVFYREGMSGSVLFVALAAVVYFVVGLKFNEPFLYGTYTVGMASVLMLVWAFTSALLFVYDKSRIHAKRVLLYGGGVILLGLGVHLLWHFVEFGWLLLLNIIAIVVYLIIFAIRNNSKVLLLISVFAVGSLVMNYSTNIVLDHMQDHQQKRIKVLLGLEEDLSGAGYNVHQSEIAIGSGGLTGKGFLKGTQTKLKYVPEQHTDFIFCTVGEEHGFIGSTFVLLLYLALLLRLIYISERQTSKMGRIYGYCVVSIFLFHVFINVGMVMGITPVIGIPLPFFSYGGSSLWGFTLLLFILLRIDAGRNRFGNRNNF